jgi:hypothetical protein
MPNESKKILSEISAGELLDKISILEIKLEKITDEKSQKIIQKEFEILKKEKNLNIKPSDELNNLIKSIKKINLSLWEIEDKIRVCEQKKDFSDTFVQLARSVYFKNDERSKVKYAINKLLGSNIIEIKKYSNYQ